jgi:hypothetical protein
MLAGSVSGCTELSQEWMEEWMKSVLSRRGMFSGHVVVRQWMIFATKGPPYNVHVYLDERVGLDCTVDWTRLGCVESFNEGFRDGWMNR